MTPFTLTDLKSILDDCAGEVTEEVDSPLNLDRELADLGYDSLSVLELSVRIKRQYAVVIPDDLVTVRLTPRQALQLVNNPEQGLR